MLGTYTFTCACLNYKNVNFTNWHAHRSVLSKNCPFYKIALFYFSKVDELNNQNVACGILTAVRVIRYLTVPTASSLEGNSRLL